MNDRFDAVVRGLIGVGLLACVVAAAAVRPDPLPPQARTTWMRLGAERTAAKHAPLRTFVIDTVTVGKAARAYGDGPLSIALGAPFALRGWAFDPGSQRSAARLLYRIDGGAWRDAAYHRPRPDVSAALGMPDVEDSGFVATISTAGLRPGHHTVALATAAERSPPNVLPVLVPFNVMPH